VPGAGSGGGNGLARNFDEKVSEPLDGRGTTCFGVKHQVDCAQSGEALRGRNRCQTGWQREHRSYSDAEAGTHAAPESREARSVQLSWGASSRPAVWAVSRYLAGLSSAAGLILGSGLLFNWVLRSGKKPELGIHFSGIGLSIALCAVAVELMSHSLDWRQQWFGFSALGVLLLIPALGWLPTPESAAREGPSLADRPPSRRFLVTLIAAYFCAGIGYVVSATFIVAVVDALPRISGHGNLIFLCIGLGGAPACIVWDLLARRAGAINALILAAALQVFSIVLTVWPGGLGWALAGAILFGSTVVGIVSLVLTLAGITSPPGRRP